LKPLIDFKHMGEIFGGTDELTLMIQADDVTEPETLRWMDNVRHLSRDLKSAGLFH